VSEQTRESRDAACEGSLSVVREDFGICEITHQNYVSGGYRPGPLSPRHESGVAWFQGKLASILSETSVGSRLPGARSDRLTRAVVDA
jgi:choline monooxygenase